MATSRFIIGPGPRVSALDDLIRMLALKRVTELRDLWGDSIPESELAKGFVVNGEVVLLKGPQGIFKPRQLSDGPLTIMSTLGSRYEDELLEDANTLNYDYAPRSREHENEGLKRLMAAHAPVILLKQVKSRPRPEYMVVAPMFVEGFDDRRRQFALSTRLDAVVKPASEEAVVLREIRRAYGETTVRTRLHQAYFRRDVLSVYRGRCTVCELQTRPLLQGAHIVPDAAAAGVAVVQNGLALCSLHHAAYDRNILRISPDYQIRVEQDWIVPGDEFGRVALSDFDGRRLVVPRDPDHRPSRDFLAARFNS
jgi:putative restriction endonuclease